MGSGLLAWPDSIALLGVLATIAIAVHAYFSSKRPIEVPKENCATKGDVLDVQYRIDDHHTYTREANHRIYNALDLTNKSLAVILDRTQRE